MNKQPKKNPKGKRAYIDWDANDMESSTILKMKNQTYVSWETMKKMR